MLAKPVNSNRVLLTGSGRRTPRKACVPTAKSPSGVRTTTSSVKSAATKHCLMICVAFSPLSNKLAPCGRTFLIHHMPGAPPTSPSTQSCQRELSHGLFPIPVRSSVWWDTATGTITPSLDLAQFVIDHAVTWVPHLPEQHLPAATCTPQRIPPCTGQHALTVGLLRHDAIRPLDQPPQRHHQRGEHPLHLLGFACGMQTIIANAMEPFGQNMLHHPTDKRQRRDLFLLTLLGLVIVIPIPHPLTIVAQDASEGGRGTEEVFRQV